MVKSASKNTLKSASKLPVIRIIIAVVIFAAIGGLIIGFSHAGGMQYDASALNSGCKSYPTLRKGSKGSCVKAVQTAINNYSDFMNFFYKKGYSKLKVDGVYGDSTVYSVAVYQKNNGLAADGIVGPKTWDKIGNDCRAYRACVFGSTK